MFKRPLLIVAMIILVVALSYLDILAFRFFWYWRLWWFDIVMHILGGLFLGMAGLWFYVLSNKLDLKSISLPRALVITFFFAVVIGVVWEFIEFGVDRFYFDQVGFKNARQLQLGFKDSVGDMIFNVIGSLLAALVVIKTSKWKQKISE